MASKHALIVAEKPSIAKGIAQLLCPGQPTRIAGSSQFNPNWKFPYTFNNKDYSIVCTSVSGHMKGMDFPSAYRKWKSCVPSALFQLPVELTVKEDAKNIHKNLTVQAKRASVLVIATDNDREGENIGFEIIEECKRVNANIQVLRMKFGSLTRHEITHAMQHLVPPDELASDACRARSEIDLRIGCVFTRFQTLRIQQLYPDLQQKLVSYGPCQFPTLGFIVDRYCSREAFITEDFYKIIVNHTVEGSKVQFNWARIRIFDELLTSLLTERCVAARTATVTRVVGRETSRRRPIGLTTTALQQIASRKYRLSPADTLATAEKLYQVNTASCL